MSYLMGFAYKRGRSILYRFDPRTKFVLGLSVAITLSFFVSGVLSFFALITLISVAFFALNLKDQLFSILRSSIYLVLIIFAANLYFTKNVVYSFLVLERLVMFIELFSLFSITTSPDDLAASLNKMGIPYTLTLSFTIAIRFIPTIALELKLIEDSQRARGLELDKGFFVSRLKRYVPVLIPLLVITILKVDQVAEAMESRCFGAVSKPTMLKEPRFTVFDWFISLLSLTFLFYCVYHYFYLKGVIILP